jgi:hypothetical protein
VNTLEAIEHFSLSVRRIPLTITRLHSMRHYHPDTHTIEIREVSPEWQSSARREYEKQTDHSDLTDYFEQDGKIFRRFAVQTIVPRNAGWWLCQQTPYTNSTVHWSKDNNLAPTLEESVSLWRLSNPNKVNAA